MPTSAREPETLPGFVLIADLFCVLTGIADPYMLIVYYADRLSDDSRFYENEIANQS